MNVAPPNSIPYIDDEWFYYCITHSAGLYLLQASDSYQKLLAYGYGFGHAKQLRILQQGPLSSLIKHVQIWGFYSICLDVSLIIVDQIGRSTALSSLN